MKICPVCHFCYEDSFSLCPADESMLEAAMAGSTILDNKFRLESRLGKGGMGLVYRAMHLGLKRYVAIKTLLPKNLSQKEFIDRFRREAEALGRLKHPNIVSVMDFGFTKIGREDVGYLVMEYLSGTSLNSLIKEKKTFSLDETVKIMSQVADAVSAAHSVGILHRDLKPDNIFIEDKTTFKLKVLDFGLAKVTDPTSSKETLEPEETLSKYVEPILRKLAKRDAVSSNSSNKVSDSVGSFEITQERKNLRTAEVFANTESMNLGTQDFAEIKTDIFNTTVEYVTHTGAMVGTLPYMSPEQCCAKPATSASDVYSLGVIAYEMLTGRRPFLGKSFELALQHINEDPDPPSKFAVHLSKSVDEAILNALAKPLTERTSSAKEFVLELGKELEEKRKRNENLRRIAVGAMIAASLILIITTFASSTNRTLIASYWYGNSKEEKNLAVNYSTVLKLVSLSNKKDSLLEKSPNILLRPEQVFEYQNELHFFTRFSSDGNLLAYFHPSKGINVWDVSTGKVLYNVASEKLINRITSICFSNDSKYLIIAGVNKLLILNASDGSMIKTIDNFEINTFLQPFGKEEFLVSSLRHPVLEQVISGTRYPLNETNSLVSIWRGENKLSQIVQQYGEIEFISLKGSLMLIEWRVSEKSPTRRIELWSLEGNSSKLLESWLANGNAKGDISNNGKKVALHLSEEEITELDLISKKELKKYKVKNSSAIMLSYDEKDNLVIIDLTSIKDLYSDSLLYLLPKNSRVLEINWKNKTLLLQHSIRENS
ncbi:MAG: protein kinase [Acidobacteria bacterium]|nr:protein kinase [Acidobacteriota bacterium]